MKTSTLVFYLLALCSMPVYAQFSEMVGKPYSQQIDAINRLYRLVGGDRQVLADTLSAMRALAKASGDDGLRMEAEALAVFDGYRNVDERVGIEAMRGLMAEALRQGVDHVAYRMNQAIARYFWDKMDYEQAFRWSARLDSLLRHVSMADFPDKTLYLKDIGEAHYHFGDYPEAIGYFRRATREWHPFFENAWKHAMNTMGLSYLQLGDLERSDSCFMQVLANNHTDTEVWEGIVAGNLGYNQYVRGDHGAAWPLFEKDIRIAEAQEDWALAAGSAIPLADILIAKRMLAPAKALLDKAQGYIGRSGQSDRLRKLYPVLSRWHMVAGQPTEAAVYLDSALAAEKRHHDKFNALLLMRAKQETMASQRDAALQELRVASARRVNHRNLVLSALTMLLMGTGFLAYRQRQVGALRLKERDLKLLQADKALHDVRRQLEDLARSVAENEQVADEGDLVERLQKQVVLTDEGWAKFSDLFAKLHPGFQHRLKAAYPALTPAEIRCLAMERLRYTNKEMAALQGISTNAVMVTKHRIRKKMGLPSHEEMARIVQEL